MGYFLTALGSDRPSNWAIRNLIRQLKRVNTFPVCYRPVLCSFVYLWLSTGAVTAQISNPFTARLTTTNGLPHNSVMGVEQDRAGFVWMATYDGLARYDGRTTKVFRNRPGDSLSLADNHITELLPAPDGTFILNMDSGTVQQFDPTTERFTTLIHRQFMDRNKVFFNRIQLSADGKQLWGLLPGVRLVNYDIQRKTLRVFDVPAIVGSLNELHHFILAPSGHIYGETLTGLFQFDTRTGHKRIIPFPFKTLDREREMNFLSLNNHQVALGPNGQIAVFGFNVVALYDPLHDRFRTVPIPQVAKAETSHARKMATTVSYALKTMVDNRLYMGYMNRLYRFDEPNQLTLIHQAEPATSRLAPWLIDWSGVLWVSNEATGLIKQKLNPLPFNFLPKRKSFNEDLLEQHLGVTLPESYEVWDSDNWPRYTMDHTGTGYLIDPSRVYRYSLFNHTLTEMAKFSAMDGKICCKHCLKTSGWSASGQHSGSNRTTGTGLIWVYNNRRGLMAVSPDETKGYAYPNSQLPLRALNPGFDAGDIQPMGHSVWIGGQHELGLFRYDLRYKRLDKPLLNGINAVNSLAEQTINCLSADPTDSTTLWIGTEGGLCLLDTRTMRFQRLSESEGFPTVTIQSMETDNQGMLWCGTNRGLLRLSRNARRYQSLTWQHFTTKDGLAEDGFRPNSSARLPDGRLVFGTPNGRVIFNPAAIRETSYEPPLVLTSLLINNQLVEANQPGSPLSAPINTLSELVLDHTQNFLTIAFAGLDYGKAEKLNYRYKLVGVDANWVTVGQQNMANYTQLVPGRYVFSVNSTTADGRWSRQIKQLSIRIKPPFWATWWAYLLYILTFGGLVLGFIRFRIRQAHQQQEITLKRREAEQLRAVDEVKTRFFSNITHEFRTPLTLILSPAEKLLKDSQQGSAAHHALTSIHHNAGHLLRLINQLLDLSKLEGRSMNVALVRGDGIALIERLVETFYPMAASRGIALYLEANNLAGDNHRKPWLFDADKWEKIVTNLLSNALKFTPTGGKVVLRIELPAPDWLVLRLADTGVGISAEHIPHIFDRFYQVDTSRTRAYEGTGIGLALVKELTDVLGGTITVESRTEAPGGTTFTLTLPIRSATDQDDAPELVLPNATTLVAPSGLKTTDLGPTPPVADDAPLVLVVDDNEELRTFIARELMDRYRVLMAADGEEGWGICQRELPDVVITDVMMPRLDGYQLTQRIKSTMATNHIAVVLLTARAAHESRIAGLEQGADDYLTKPFHTDELALRLDNMLTRQANLRAHLHRQLSTPPVTDEPVIDAFVGQLHQAIEMQLDDTTFGIDELAQAVAMSRRTLNRKLTATANMAASDFIRHYRLQRATQLLKDGRSISETAYGVGFESPAYFATVFKQTYHQTPSEFVNHLRA